MVEGERTIITELIDNIKMETKVITLFISWLIGGVSNEYMPHEWYIMYLPELSVLSVTTGACLGYTLWLLWLDYPKIVIFIQSMWEFEMKKLIERRKLKKQNQ